MAKVWMHGHSLTASPTYFALLMWLAADDMPAALASDRLKVL